MGKKIPLSINCEKKPHKIRLCRSRQIGFGKISRNSYIGDKKKKTIKEQTINFTNLSEKVIMKFMDNTE